MQVFVPVSQCKDTHNFDKANNYFKKREKNKSSLLFGNFKNAYLYITLASYSKLTELLYYFYQFKPTLGFTSSVKSVTPIDISSLIFSLFEIFDENVPTVG